MFYQLSESCMNIQLNRIYMNKNLKLKNKFMGGGIVLDTNLFEIDPHPIKYGFPRAHH
ncbi:hypothetical protein ES706_01135 [subsurface metagenome]